MKINARIEDLSDGKLYGYNDMVKADTHDCKDCSHCCHGIADTMVLNPFDLYEIQRSLHLSYEELQNNKIDLHEEDKLMIPNLKMTAETEGCGFLSEEGRCSIHKHRPGVCRLFPLGRYYEQDDLKYFIQSGECVKSNLSKIKVKKWIGIANYDKNKAFLMAWLGFIKAMRFRVKFIYDEQELKAVNQDIINTFYSDWLDVEDFYTEFYVRLSEAKNRLGVL